MPVWVHQRRGEKWSTDIVKAKHISYQNIFNEETTIITSTCQKTPWENETKEIEKFIYFEASSSHNASKGWVRDRLNLGWDFSGFLRISGSQVLLHSSQWIERLVRCISTAGYQQNELTSFAFCASKMPLKMQSLESVNVVSQKFLWRVFGNYTRINDYSWSELEKKNTSANHWGRW